MQWSLNQTRWGKASVKINYAGVDLMGAGPPDWTESIGGDPMYFNSPLSVGKPIGEIKSDIALPMLPEMLDTVKQAVGTGYAEQGLPLSVSLYEPNNSAGIYTISNDNVWLAEDAFKAPAEGATHALKLLGLGITDWNGVQAIDLAARGGDPGLLGALFAAVGLIL